METIITMCGTELYPDNTDNHLTYPPRLGADIHKKEELRLKAKKLSFCHKHGRCTAMIKTMGLFTLVLIFFNAMACTALAADPLQDSQLIGTNSPLNTMYTFFLKISVPIAVLGLAMCAFAFFLPNEKGYEVAKKRMFHIGVAIMVLFLIPSIYNFSSTKFSNDGWKAEGNNMQIIQNAGEAYDLKTNGPTPVPEGSGGSDDP